MQDQEISTGRNPICFRRDSESLRAHEVFLNTMEKRCENNRPGHESDQEHTAGSNNPRANEGGGQRSGCQSGDPKTLHPKPLYPPFHLPLRGPRRPRAKRVVMIRISI
ncbi:hypothetical protein DPEC_G00272320 [Dallia pectoralis]|uniref:Uncharacterized protein n=1 Tax=Dallia pectoralis TaxID=75939 RepID=A0ACC2FPY3_DALPE|nr:hypothetical protein DPEC_G00272320 [Dallia pectoralis]